jgi:hypothetical protein
VSQESEEKSTNDRTSILSRDGAPGVIGFSNDVWNDRRARPWGAVMDSDQQRFVNLHRGEVVPAGTDATGQDDAKNVRAIAEAAGIKIVAAESFGLSDTNFTAQLVRIRDANADLFWNQSTGGRAIRVYEQARQLQIKTPMAVSLAAVSGAFFPVSASATGRPGFSRSYRWAHSPARSVAK